MAKTILISAAYPLSSLACGVHWSGRSAREADATYERNVRREKRRVREIKKRLWIDPERVL